MIVMALFKPLRLRIICCSFIFLVTAALNNQKTQSGIAKFKTIHNSDIFVPDMMVSFVRLPWEMGGLDTQHNQQTKQKQKILRKYGYGM